MSVSYVVRPLSAAEAPTAAHAWNDLADGTLDQETVSRVERLLAQSGSENFAAFGAEVQGKLCGIATARVSSHVLAGAHGEIEALMIDERLPDEAGDDLARAAIGWLRDRGVLSISHLRDADAPGRFWERLGFRLDKVRYTLSG